MQKIIIERKRKDAEVWDVEGDMPFNEHSCKELARLNGLTSPVTLAIGLAGGGAVYFGTYNDKRAKLERPATPEPDAYYVEAVDAVGDRHWSDVMMNDGLTMAELHEATVGMAECEPIDLRGMAFRYYPLHLSTPAASLAYQEGGA